MATVHPSFSAPSSASTGTRTSLKNSSLNSCSPVMVTAGAPRCPATSCRRAGRRCPCASARRGRCAPAARTSWRRCPSVFHTFWPLTTIVRRRRAPRARRSAARSEPASGSEKPWHQMSSPRSMRAEEAAASARRCRTCMMAGAMFEMPITLRVPGASAGHLLGEHDLLEQPGATPAVLRWPRDARRSRRRRSRRFQSPHPLEPTRRRARRGGEGRRTARRGGRPTSPAPRYGTTRSRAGS